MDAQANTNLSTVSYQGIPSMMAEAGRDLGRVANSSCFIFFLASTLSYYR